MTTFIYVLRDPRTDEPRYIGKTKDIYQRLWSHTLVGERLKKSNYNLYTWLRGLKDDGLLPVLEIVDRSTHSKAGKLESEWISWGYANGLRLFNVQNAGPRNIKKSFPAESFETGLVVGRRLHEAR